MHEDYKYKVVLDALPGLSHNDLTKVKGLVDTLLAESIANTGTGIPSTYENDIYAALCRHTAVRNVTLPPLSVVMGNPKLGKKYRESCTNISNFIDICFGSNLNKRHRMAILHVLMGLIIEAIDNLDTVPLTIGPIVANMSRVDAYFDHAFPGYAGSSIALGVVRNLCRRLANAEEGIK